jgi:hypothetical protein
MAVSGPPPPWGYQGSLEGEVAGSIYSLPADPIFGGPNLRSAGKGGRWGGWNCLTEPL